MRFKENVRNLFHRINEEDAKTYEIKLRTNVSLKVQG